MRTLSNGDGTDRGPHRSLQVNVPATGFRWWFSLADVTLLPIYILWFIWQLQFVARWTWMFFVVWIVVSFAVHRDLPKALGWRADNLIPASKQAVIFFGIMAAGLVAVGLALSAPTHLLPGLFSWNRFGGYFAFCLLQQVALNSLVHNHMMSLVPNEYVAATLTGIIFAACHWPNPVLVPLTLIGGAVMAWMFGRIRNIIPLTIGQAILGSLVFWAFPIAWQHHLRVGPGYYAPFR
ncbi:MAG TPA: hypothetical protein VMF66_06255 [Candidatus Acidoferrum sp.]|nr:hypothetical protein [Candidatus Acidoferrum sp.]